MLWVLKYLLVSEDSCKCKKQIPFFYKPLCRLPGSVQKGGVEILPTQTTMDSLVANSVVKRKQAKEWIMTTWHSSNWWNKRYLKIKTKTQQYMLGNQSGHTFDREPNPKITDHGQVPNRSQQARCVVGSHLVESPLTRRLGKLVPYSHVGNGLYLAQNIAVS